MRVGHWLLAWLLTSVSIASASHSSHGLRSHAARNDTYLQSICATAPKWQWESDRSFSSCQCVVARTHQLALRATLCKRCMLSVEKR